MDILPTLESLLGTLSLHLGKLADQSFSWVAFALRNFPGPFAIYIVFAAFLIYPPETQAVLETRRAIGVLAIGAVLEYFHHFLAAPTTQKAFLSVASIYIFFAIVALVFAAVLKGSDPRVVEVFGPAEDADDPQDPIRETWDHYDETRSEDENNSVDLEVWGVLKRENKKQSQQIQDLENQLRDVNDANERLHIELRLQRTRFEQQAERNKESLADRDKQLSVVKHALRFKEEDVVRRSEALKEIDDELSRIEPSILVKIGKLSRRVKRSYDAERKVEEEGEDWVDSWELEKLENRKNRESKLQDENNDLNSEIQRMRRQVDGANRALSSKDDDISRNRDIQRQTLDGLRVDKKNDELTIKTLEDRNSLLSQQLSERATALRSKDEELSRYREIERQNLADSRADKKKNFELESKEIDHKLKIQDLEGKNRLLSQQLIDKTNELTRKDEKLTQHANTERQSSVKEDEETLTQLRDENTKLQHTIDELRGEIRALSERESINKDNSEADFKKDEEFFNKATGLCDGIEDNLKELKPAYQRIAELEGENNKIFETAAELEEKNRSLSDELTKKTDEQTQKNKAQALDTETVHQRNAELGKEKTDLLDRATQLETDKKFIYENLARRQKELDQKNDELSRYRDTDTQQRQRITDLGEENSKLLEKAKELDDRVQPLYEEVTEKAEELIQKVGEVSRLEDENKKLSGNVAELDEKVQSLSEEVAKKQEDLTWMEEEVSRLQDENSELSEKSEKVEQKNQSLAGDLTKKTAELGKKEEELARRKETDAAADQEDAEIIEKISDLVEKIESDVEEIKAEKAARESTSDHSPDEPYVLVVENFEPGTTAEDVIEFLRSQDIRFCDCKVVQEEPSVTVKIYLLGLEAATFVQGWNGNLADGRELKAYFDNGSESDDERYSGAAGSAELTGAVRWPNPVRGKKKRYGGQRHSL